MADFFVKNIKCSGCANQITKSLSKNGFENVVVDVENSKVSLELGKNSEQSAKDALLKLGYPAVDEHLTSVQDGLLKAKSFVSCAIGRVNK